jgi:hypothetical protein
MFAGLFLHHAGLASCMPHFKPPMLDLRVSTLTLILNTNKQPLSNGKSLARLARFS